MTCASIGQVAQTRLVVQAWCCKPLHYFDVLEEHVQCSFDFTSYEDSYLQFSDVHPVGGKRDEDVLADLASYHVSDGLHIWMWYAWG